METAVHAADREKKIFDYTLMGLFREDRKPITVLLTCCLGVQRNRGLQPAFCLNLQRLDTASTQQISSVATG